MSFWRSLGRAEGHVEVFAVKAATATPAVVVAGGTYIAAYAKYAANEFVEGRAEVKTEAQPEHVATRESIRAAAGLEEIALRA